MLQGCKNSAYKERPELDFSLLKRLCETPGVPGQEGALRSVVTEAMRPLVDSIEVDVMGNVIGRKSAAGPKEQPLAGVTAGLVEDAMSRAGRRPVWRGERGLLAAAIAERAAEGDVVLTLGAGDITRTGPELLRLLVERA